MISYQSMLEEPYLGIGSAAESMQRFVDTASRARCAVLLLGESGTGKGVTARQIHDRGPRKKYAFVDINCAGLKGELLKSELFGHVRGAFTGAICDRPGLIEEADGGTLFLDEIGDMDVSVQCQILKTIEEKCFRRIGENKPRTSDFRLICATNRNLSRAMANGEFREDLFYRINTLMTRIPSLGERTEDIPGLLDHILKVAGYNHFPVCGSVIALLQRRRWHGNIREFRNAVERALALARGKRLTIEHFAESVAEVSPTPAETRSQLAEPFAEYRVFPRNIWNIDELEDAHVLHALKYFDNNKHKTSEALGISLSSLYRRLDNIRKKEVDGVLD